MEDRLGSLEAALVDSLEEGDLGNLAEDRLDNLRAGLGDSLGGVPADILEEDRLDTLEEGRFDILEEDRLDSLEEDRLDILEEDLGCSLGIEAESDIVDQEMRHAALAENSRFPLQLAFALPSARRNQSAPVRCDPGGGGDDASWQSCRRYCSRTGSYDEGILA